MSNSYFLLKSTIVWLNSIIFIGNLRINSKEFVDTLGHEMVHLYQMANVGDPGNHNKLFYSFRPKLNRIGLDL